VPSATRTVSRCGLILEMVINAALQALIMGEGQDIFLSQVVKAMLLIMVIQASIIQN